MKPARSTKSKEIESLRQRLAETEARFNALTEGFPVAVGISTDNGTFLYINDAYYRIFGYTLDEINRIKSTDLYLDPDDRLKWLAILQAAGSVKDYEVQLKRKDGTTFWAEISVVPIQFDGKKAYFGSVVDVSERKRMEAGLHEAETLRRIADALQAERQRLYDVLETLPVMVCLLTVDYHVAFANRAFRDTFGESNGRHCYEYCFGKDQPCDFCESFDVFKTGQPHHWEAHTPEGKVIDAYDYPFTDVDGTPMILEMDIDITDRRRYEEQLKGYHQNLEEMVKERTTRLEAEIDVRNKVEASLRKNEAMLRLVLDQMPSGVTVRDAKTGELILANNQSREIMGKLADNLAQFASYKGLHPDGRPYEVDEWPVSRSIATGEVVNSEEIECERSDGSHIIISMSSAPVRDDKGQIISGVGIFHDITARKHAEERLTYLASFPENNPRPIVEVSLDGKLNYLNPTARRLFPDLVDKGTSHPWMADWDDVAHRFVHDQQPVTLRDIEVGGRYYQQAISYFEKKGLIRIYGLDITTQKEAEQALQLSEARYRSIVETAAEGISLAQPTGEYIYVNRQMANMLGYQVDEILGKTGLDFMFTPQRSELQKMRRTLHQGAVLRGEFKFRRKDGSAFWSMFNASPVYSDKGEHIANLAMHTDITERKESEQALRLAHEELERRVQERTQDLNTANNQLRAEVDEREKAQVELESSVQELQVIEEELRNNNEMLMDAQKVLETERQRYQDLFEFAPDAYLVTDRNGKVIEANQNTTTLLGITLQNLVGKPLNVFINQADHAQYNHLLAALHRHESMPPQEFRLMPRQGPEIISSAKVAMAEDGGKSHTLRWTIRDITARKRSEEIIRQNSLRNAVLSEVSQSLAEASLDENAVLDMIVKTTARLVGDSCVITLVSAGGQGPTPSAWHHKKPEVIDLMSSLYGSAQNPAMIGAALRVFESTRPLLVKEFQLEDPPESIPPQFRKYMDLVGISSMLIAPIQIGGKIVGTLGLTRDRGGQPYTQDDQSMLEILATRTGQSIHNARLYQELQSSLRKELETHDQLVQSEKFAVVGRLLASITHEINNPLQTIKNCLYLSQMDTSPGTPVYDALNIASAETNRLSNLVAQLREMYRPPTMGLSKQVSLPTLVDEVQVLLASYLQDKHVLWQVTPPNDVRFSRLAVEGVPDQLKQVFLNICLNAIDAMEQQGGDLKIEFKVSADANLAGVCFQDTGPGLAPEVKAKLFEPFTTTKEKGLGLGLVICYDIIHKHNGHIEVDSEPGKGAAFTVWLPARRETA